MSSLSVWVKAWSGLDVPVNTCLGCVNGWVGVLWPTRLARLRSGLLMRVTGQIGEVILVPHVPGLCCAVCNDVFKCFAKIRGVKFNVPVG